MTAKKKTNEKKKAQTTKATKKKATENEIIQISIYFDKQSMMSEFLQILKQLENEIYANNVVKYEVSLGNAYCDPIDRMQGCTFIFTIETNGKDISQVWDAIGGVSEFGSVGVIGGAGTIKGEWSEE